MIEGENKGLQSRTRMGIPVEKQSLKKDKKFIHK